MSIDEPRDDLITKLLQNVVVLEAGFVDNPFDRGGVTQWGISLRYLRSKGIDLDSDGNTDARDIRLVTPEIAVTLYRQDFYYGPQYDLLPIPIAAPVVDAAVMSSPRRASRMLQRAVNRLVEQRLRIDGYVGPATAAAVQDAVREHGEYRVIVTFTYERIQFYGRIVTRHRPQYTFYRGWINRATEFLL